MNGFATAEPKAPPKVMPKYALDFVHYREVPERTPVNVLLWQLKRNADRAAQAQAAPAEPVPPKAAPAPDAGRKDYVHYRTEPLDDIIGKLFPDLAQKYARPAAAAPEAKAPPVSSASNRVDYVHYRTEPESTFRSLFMGMFHKSGPQAPRPPFR